MFIEVIRGKGKLKNYPFFHKLCAYVDYEDLYTKENYNGGNRQKIKLCYNFLILSSIN